MPMIDFIVTHYDEPWSVGKKFFDMLALQRHVNFSDIRVILIQDGKEGALPWGQVMDKYPYQIKCITINGPFGPAFARNTGMNHAGAEWVMFCDFDDMFSSVVSVHGIMQVLPTNDADIIWMKSYREERMRASKKEKCGSFVNCLDENFSYTHGKLYRRSALVENKIRFDPHLQYEYESHFNHLCLSIIPSFRIMKLTVDFYPYMKTLRDDSYTMNPVTVSDRVLSILRRDMSLVKQYDERNMVREYKAMIAETVFDAYYILNCKPTIRNVDEVRDAFFKFFDDVKEYFYDIRPTEINVILDNCLNKMLSVVQHMYNYHGIEADPPYDGLDRIMKWLENKTDTEDTTATVVAPHEAANQSPSGQRVVVYCGTYNTYDNMVTSAKSLLAHTRVDKVYFLTEDNASEFPYELPDIITVINVKNQDIFPESGPNFDNVWSYMCLMRAAFPQLFSDCDRILSLDIDVIINEDISDLWDVDLTDFYFAGVPEPSRQQTTDDSVYCNFGVIMMNLEKLRNDGKDKEIIDLLNTSRLGCPEQDAFNRVCAHHILALPPDYNFTPFSHITGEPEREIITHYAGLKYWKHFGSVRKYAGKTWNEILKREDQ